MTNLEKIKNIIQDSKLKKEKKKEFIEALILVDDKYLKEFVDFLGKEPKWLPVFYYNFKAKKSAAIINDPKLWDKIFQLEKEMLAKLGETLKA